MKKICLSLGVALIFGANTKIQAQSYYSLVYHPELTAQVSMNNAVRMGSIYNLKNQYEKQKEAYEDVRENIAKVFAVHEYIYQQLRNVNSLFKQGKKLKYVIEYVVAIEQNRAKTVQLLIQNPQYSVFLKGPIITVWEKTLELVAYIQEVIKKGDRRLLMDYFERDVLLETVYTKLQAINFSLQVINYRINYAKSRPYIYSIPYIGNYIYHDKIMVQSIINHYNIFESL